MQRNSNRHARNCRPPVWRFNHKIRSLPAGKILRIETLAPARIHWSADEWRSVEDVSTRDVGLGLHTTDLPTAELAESTQVKFTFYWPEVDRWEGTDFMVRIAAWGEGNVFNPPRAGAR